MLDGSASFRCAFAFALLFLLNGLSVSARVTISTDPNYILDRWETTDGLPENSATSLVQTPDGYLWFGTFNGLVRFDGIRCKVFDATNTPELPNGEIVMLFLDRIGGLWVSTSAGVARLENGRWKRLTPAPGWKGNYVRSFAGRANGDVLLTTFDGHVIERHGGRFQELPEPPGAKGQGYIAGIAENEEWWVVQNEFVGSWDGKQWVRRLTLPTLPGSQVGATQARAGGIWVLAGTELRLIQNGVEAAHKTIPEAPGGLWSAFEDSAHTLWISSFDKGVLQVPQGGPLKRWDSKAGFSQDSARATIEDNEGNHWIGTAGGGLIRLKAKRVRTYNALAGLPSVAIQCAAETKEGTLLLGSFGKGVYEFTDGKGSKFLTPWERENPNTLNVYLHSLLVDSVGRIWAGASDLGFCVRSNGVDTIFTSEPAGKNVQALFEDREKRIWVGGDERICVLDSSGWKQFDSGSGLKGREFRRFAEDAKGRIWAANSESAFVLNGERFEEINGNGRSIRGITCFLAAFDDGMWIGTINTGLYYWKDGVLTAIGPDQGLGAKTIRNMAIDREGAIWIGSNAGVFRVRRGDLRRLIRGRQPSANFIQLGLGDGLETVDVAGGQNSSVVDHSGRLWFSTLSGIVEIDAAHFAVRTNAPFLHVDEVAYSDRRGKRQRFHPTAGQLFVAPPGSTRFEAWLVGISLSDPEGVTYYSDVYKDGELYDSGSQKTSLLNAERLPPGDYKMDIRAASSDGAMTATAISYAFKVDAFFWERLWFQIMAPVCAIGLIGGVAWVWIRSLRSSEKRYRAVVEFSPIGICVSVDDRVVMANSSLLAMLGFTQERTILGRNVYEFIDPKTHDFARERRQKALEKNEIAPGAPFDIKRADGSYCHAIAFALRFTYNSRPAILNFVVDDTARRLADLDKERAEAEIRELAGRLISIQDEERRRIGRDLHDSTGQTLAALEINLGMLNRRLASSGGQVADLVSECSTLASQCSGEIRTTSYLLHPPLLDEVGLASALRWYADGFTRRSGIVVNLSLPEKPTRFAPEVELALFRVVQEALTNIHRHSGSTMASINFSSKAGSVELQIVDDGHGFEAEQLRLFGEGHANLGVGISGMRERIRQLGGKLIVESSGRGTQVRVELPLIPGRE